MSNSGATVSKGRTDSERTQPRAILHKQILDAAEERPDASMEELAEEISFANTTLVERVLEEYGDPGNENEEGEITNEDETIDAVTIDGTMAKEDDESADRADRTEEYDDATMPDETEGDHASVASTDDPTDNEINAETDLDSDTDSPSSRTTATDHDMGASTEIGGFQSDVDSDTNPAREEHGADIEPSDLTEKQRETLETVQNRPAATQAQLADELGVTSATINQRVNSIDGFDWSDRHAFVKTVFGESGASTDRAEHGTTRSTETTTSNTTKDPNGADPRDSADSDVLTDTQQYATLATSIRELTDRFEALEQQLESQSGSASALTEPDIAHKVIHACLASNQISEEEELEILEHMLSG